MIEDNQVKMLMHPVSIRIGFPLPMCETKIGAPLCDPRKGEVLLQL